MIDEKTVKLLEEQKEKKYTYENIDKLELVKILLDDIGNPNSYLRDDLIYPNLAHLLHDKHFNEDELTMFLDILKDENHLFLDLKNKESNSVLTRSFSILQLVILVFVHKRDNIISKEKINEVLHLFLDYFDKETTYEGYNKEVGFLHSIAHSADLFQQFMAIEYFGEEELKKMFIGISRKFKLKSYYFQHDEDERMVKAIVEGLKRNLLSEKFLNNWLEELTDYEKPTEYPDIYYITNNIKVLLRSLYFAILDDEKLFDLNLKIKAVLKNKVTLR